MFIPNFREPLLRKAWCQLNESRPNPPMNISDFAVNQLADQNLGTFANGPRCSKNYAAFSVSPPTAWNRFSGNRLCEAGHWTTSGLEHYSVPLHESGCFSRTQISLSNFEFALQACLPPMLVALLEPDVAVCRSSRSARWLPRSYSREARLREDVGCLFHPPRGGHALLNKRARNPSTRSHRHRCRWQSLRRELLPCWSRHERSQSRFFRSSVASLEQLCQSCRRH